MKPFLTAALVLLITNYLSAQWVSNPLQNLPIGNANGEQVLPKLAVTSDGGCYIGWFDSSNGSYTVRLQRLDPRGQKIWAPQGILVSAQPQSTSLVDWDLICDRDDHCVLTFTDTRAGSDLDVYAYRIKGSGQQLWGPNGVTISSNADYEPNPRVCETTNGEFVIAWANTGAGDLRVQRLDRQGNPLYAANGLVIPGDTGATPAFLDVVASDAGGFILSWVRALSFSGNKHVHAQKFDAAGTPLWNGGTRLPVFDGGSVPIAHEPRLLSDGSGGAILAWHFAVGQAFSSRVQHVLANGTEAFPHDGVDVSTSPNGKFDPAIVHHAASGATFVCWNERNASQSSWGIFAQRIDAIGQRAWGTNGIALLPINTTVKFAPVIVPLLNGFVCSVLEESLGNLADKVLSMRVDGTGTAVWSTPVAACLVASDKLRLTSAITPSGVVLLAWTDKRNDGGDVFAQNLNPDGSLGDAFGAFSSYGCGVNPAGSVSTLGRPALGTTSFILLDNPLGTQAPGTLVSLLVGADPDPSYPCGTTLPGLGMGGGSGELLIQLGPRSIALGTIPWTGIGQPVAFPITLPLDEHLVGFPVYLQGVFLDVNPGAVAPVGLTTGLVVNVGF